MLTDLWYKLKNCATAPSADGAIKDVFDSRDRIFKLEAMPEFVGDSIDLEQMGFARFSYPKYFGLDGQGALPSCTGWATAYALALQTWRAEQRTGVPMTVVPGPCDLWNAARATEGVSDVSGVSLRSVFKAINDRRGFTHNPGARFTTRLPDVKADDKRLKLPGYLRLASACISNSDLVRLVLTREKQPVIGAFGISTAEMRQAGSSGDLLRPVSIDGGHAMTIFGVEGSRFLVRNSWGNEWGRRGIAYMSSSYLDSVHTWDLWTFDTHSL